MYKTCGYCGKAFSARKRPKAKYCSEACANEARKQRARAYQRRKTKEKQEKRGEIKCVVCGKPLKNCANNKKYCKECKEKTSRKIKREWQRENRKRDKKSAEAINQTVHMGRTDHQNADIGAVEEKARKAGLSYGQYMAIQRIIEMESRK
ncbi:hypothetical protein [Eubacterium callanderi]|uniref:hypothetical protein n=1 Tax=Eubacterium callanderi TaxID=53442 RepID=UPI003993E21F